MYNYKKSLLNNVLMNISHIFQKANPKRKLGKLDYSPTTYKITTPTK